jgi:hypothetical protein
MMGLFYFILAGTLKLVLLGLASSLFLVPVALSFDDIYGET